MTDVLMALPLAVVLVIVAVPVLVVLAWITYVSAWADRKVGEVLASPPSITDGFTDMGEQAAEVAWIFGDGRPRLTVIDGGNEAA